MYVCVRVCVYAFVCVCVRAYVCVRIRVRCTPTYKITLIITKIKTLLPAISYFVLSQSSNLYGRQAN